MNASKRGSLASVASVAAVAGLALFVALIVRQGVGEIVAALAAAGPGLLVVAAYHLAPLGCDAIAWRCLLPHPAARLRTLTWARWIGESVNGLLPVAQIGGNVARAAVLAQRGVPAARAGASVVVDITMNLTAQMFFTALGLGLLLLHVSRRHLALPVVVGMLVMGALFLGFYLTQRRGLFGGAAGLLGRVSRGVSRGSLASGAAALDDEVRRLYGEHGALMRTAAWHLASWVLGAGEVWLALYFLGHPVGIGTALLMESLGQALRSAAFVVPGALGVQEGGYMLMGSAFGLDPGTALALSLVKRTRELLFGLPGLAAGLLEGVLRASPAGGARVDDVGAVDR